jgi:stage V sporulation protein K
MFDSLFDINKLDNKIVLTIIDNNNVDNINFNVLNKTFKWCGELNNINDLINLANNNDIKYNDITNINIKKLENIIPALNELNDMIGINDIKNNIFNHIIFYLQDLDPELKDIHHTVIKGPPGVGKTKLAGILANIYKGLGILQEGKVIKIRREDLIAGYLGQTGEKTKKKLKAAIGNVLLFDEAYSLGNGSNDKQDSYAQQAIDQINWFLSEHGHEFICIIAGYKKELEERFFTMNPGLARRFPIHYTIDNYTPNEMYLIFKSMVIDNNWIISNKIKEDKIIAFFNTHKNEFPHYGGDINNVFAHIKKFHSKKLLEIKELDKLKQKRKIITLKDIKGGFDIYKKTNGYIIEEEDNSHYLAMYN